MYFLGLGLVLLAMKYLEYGPVAAWSWWIVLAPICAGSGLVVLGRFQWLYQAQGDGAGERAARRGIDRNKAALGKSVRKRR